MNLCPNCGNITPVGWRYCQTCTKRYQDDVAAKRLKLILAVLLFAIVVLVGAAISLGTPVPYIWKPSDESCYAAAISADGAYVALQETSGCYSPAPPRAGRWSPGGGMQWLTGDYPGADPVARYVGDVAGTGVLVGYSFFDSHYAAWQSPGSPAWTNYYAGLGCSADGTVVAGSYYDSTTQGGAVCRNGAWEILPTPYDSGYAGDITADGRLVFGEADSGDGLRPGVWNLQEPGTPYHQLPGTLPGGASRAELVAVAPSGAWLIAELPGYVDCYWHNSRYYEFPDFGGCYWSAWHAVSDTGIFVGEIAGGPYRGPALWHPTWDAPIRLEHWLRQQGLYMTQLLQQWGSLDDVWDISADGTWIVGEGWLTDPDPCCCTRPFVAHIGVLPTPEPGSLGLLLFGAGAVTLRRHVVKSVQ